MKDIDKDKKIVSIYIDVKTLYDNATPHIDSDNKELISSTELTKFLIYESFLKQIILETKNKIQNKLSTTFIQKTLGFDKSYYNQINNKLEEIVTSIENVFKRINVSIMTSVSNSIEKQKQDKINAGITVSKDPNLSLGKEINASQSLKQEFNNTFITYLDIKKSLIENLISVKEILALKYLYIYLDDYSEIDEEAQKLFMDWFICPLNNLSDDFIKFKIATYPKRFYYGKLDNQKIDEVSLDFFDAFYTFKNISKMEELALDYTKRLMLSRAKVFLPNGDLRLYFDIKDDDLFELLFELSMNIPRKMGYILSYCHESNLIHNTKITKAALGNAAIRYYDEVVKKYFESNEFVLRPFNDRISIENQKGLMDKIIKKQLSNKQSIFKSKAKLFNKEDKPTSHFVVNNDLSPLLDNLELNGYISTYNKINDKNNIPSTLFSLDYGLCRKNNLNYGRPKDTEFRKYYNDTRFNFNNLIRDYFNETQVLKCENGHEFPFELHEQFKRYNMICPTCLEVEIISKCSVVVSNVELIEKIKQLEEESIQLKDENEYNLLDWLRQNKPNSLSCTEISENIDCSWQFVNKRADKLIEQGLVEVDDDKTGKYGKRYFGITRKANELIFRN